METYFVTGFLSFTLAFKLVFSIYCNASQYEDIHGNCLMCPDHCQFCNSKGSCFTCINGYWGDACEKFCDKCKEGTSCAKSTGFCNKDCKDGYTGTFCDDKCSETCSSCNRMNAQICLNCAHGWYPPVSCHNSCPDECFNRSCSAKGVCTDGCKNGFYGKLCQLRCFGHCKDNVCYKANGTCVHGCEGNFIGTNCDTAEETGNTATVVGVVSLVLVLVFGVVIAGIIVVRRKRRRLSRFSSPEEAKEMLSTTVEKSNEATKTGSSSKENTGTSSQSNVAEVDVEQMWLRWNRLCCFDSAQDNDKIKELEAAETLRIVYIPERKKKTREEKLRECLQRINFKNKSDQEYEDEFYKLPSGKLKPNTISLQTKNRSKLEEEGVFPYDENIVEVHGKDGTELYVNASYIKDNADKKLTFIASAGSSEKVDPARLWRLCWEHGCETVVMLDTYDRIMQNRYWPKEGKIETYGTLSVKCLVRDGSKEMQQNITRFFELKKGTTTKRVDQLHYTEWPEKGIPRNIYSLLDFLRQVKLAHTKNVGPLLVHGRCGTGRTGTFIALYILSKEAEDMLDSDKDHITDVFSCVKNLRHQRVKMVENVGQYKFLHEALSCVVYNMLENVLDNQSKASWSSKGDENEYKN